MAERVYDDSDYKWSYRIDGNVAIFDMEGWLGYNDEALQSATEGYRQVVGQSDIRANVTILTDTEAIPAEQQDFIADQWAKNVNHGDIERCAFVDQGTNALIIKNRIEGNTDAEIRIFDDFDEALEWAKGAG